VERAPEDPYLVNPAVTIFLQKKSGLFYNFIFFSPFFRNYEALRPKVAHRPNGQTIRARSTNAKSNQCRHSTGQQSWKKSTFATKGKILYTVVTP